MATELTAPLIRETGLVRENGKEVMIILNPGENGGTIAFREKGKGGKGCEMPLASLMESAFGDNKETPSVSNMVVNKGHPDDPDLIDLATLESRLMIQAPEVLEHSVKVKVWEIIREIREERREDMNLPKLVVGSKRNAAKREKEREEERG